jgi:hypothetical protein
MKEMHSPLAEVGLQVDDGLGALDVSKALAPHVEHLVGGLRKQAPNVHVGLASLVLQATVEWLVWGARSGNSPRDGGLLVH